MKLRTKITALTLLCVALDGGALTLGRLRGAALIGRPLDLAVQFQFDSGEDASASCFEADVFHAETRQDPGRIRLSVEPAAQAGVAEVRVVSPATVDEPVVALNLRYGCGQKVSRRYVLLADLPDQAFAASSVPALAPLMAEPAGVKPEPSPSPAAAADASVPAPAPVAAALPAPAARAKPAQRSKPGARAKPLVGQRAGPQAKNRSPAPRSDAAAAKPAAPVAKSKSGPAAAQPRLKLDPLEVLSDRVANLAAPATVQAPPQASPDLKKMQTLEGEVRALRDSAVKNEKSLAELKAQLQQAQAQSSSGVVVYVLVALVLCCLLALAWLWRRQRPGSVMGREWWRGAIANRLPAAGASAGEGAADLTATRQGAEPAALESAEPHRAGADFGASPGLQVHAVELSDSALDDFMRAGVADGANRGRSMSANAHARNLNSDAVLEIRRRADYLVAIGRPEQAVDILKRQLGEGDEPNPNFYLDLLGILHAANLKSDFQKFSQDFNLLFNGRIPEFAVFKKEGKDLGSHPEVLQRITGCWSTPKVLELIESCIFRDPWTASDEPFDLAAMRDLLLLHAIAQSHGLDAAAGTATHAPAGPDRAPSDPSAPTRDIPHDLDLDLSDLGIEAASTSGAPLAEINLDRLVPSVRQKLEASELDTRYPELNPPPRNPGQRPG